MQQAKTILVAPLNWGLGHASRCIPIIHKLLCANCKVVLAADGQALQLLRSEFPELPFEVFPGIKTAYSKFIPIPILMLLRSPKLFKSIKKEHAQLKRLIQKHEVNGIISDNRYGCYHNYIPSIIITHQIALKTPFFKKQAQNMVKNLIARFDRCWIPDISGDNNLSGELSHSPSDLKNLQFIGSLSRFKKGEGEKGSYSRKLLVLLSGPEPSRTIFENEIAKQLETFNEEVLIVRGKLRVEPPTHKNPKVNYVSHLPTTELQMEIEQSELVLCRSGYSSIMDLARIGKKVLLVPTPGQTEQEYLAKWLMNQGRCWSVKQSALKLSEAIETAVKFNPLTMEDASYLLDQQLEKWLESINQ